MSCCCNGSSYKFTSPVLPEGNLQIKTNKMKVAKLVRLSITVRVVVDENDSDDDLALEAARKEIVNNQFSYFSHDYIESVENDTECPYGTKPHEI